MIKQGYDLTGRLIPENEVKQQIKELLAYTCVLWNVVTGKFKVSDRSGTRWITTFPKGTPDILGFRKKDGKMFFIEVKTSKGKLSKEQKEFGEFIKDYPVLYGVARSVEDALKIINGD